MSEAVRGARGRRAGERTALLAAVLVGAVYAGVALAGYAVAQRLGAEDWPLQHDQLGYFAYLPALLREDGLSFEWGAGPSAEIPGGRELKGFRRDEDSGRIVNWYTPGVAVLQAPFFAVGHAVAAATGAPRDGFSGPYRILATLGGATYAALGLALLASALGGLFPQGVAAGVVLILGLGTNLFYYATLEPLMSHAYSFFALAGALLATLRWAERPRLRTALLLGAAVGLAACVRPTNLLFAVVPVGYALARRGRDGLPRLAAHGAAAAAAGLVAILPLLAYWRYASGSWITNPYGGRAFHFADPEIGRLLWSYRKGWFVYTPAMLALLPGLALVRRHAPGLAIPLLLYFGGAVYLAAAWWVWWYGGSLGMRAMIEVTAPMSVALAAFLAWGAGTRARRRISVTAFALLVALNLFQTYQYVQTYIRWDGMSRASYWAVFLRPYIPRAELETIHRELNQEGQRERPPG